MKAKTKTLDRFARKVRLQMHEPTRLERVPGRLEVTYTEQHRAEYIYHLAIRHGLDATIFRQDDGDWSLTVYAPEREM